MRSGLTISIFLDRLATVSRDDYVVGVYEADHNLPPSKTIEPQKVINPMMRLTCSRNLVILKLSPNFKPALSQIFIHSIQSVCNFCPVSSKMY